MHRKRPQLAFQRRRNGIKLVVCKNTIKKYGVIRSNEWQTDNEACTYMRMSELVAVNLCAFAKSQQHIHCAPQSQSQCLRRNSHSHFNNKLLNDEFQQWNIDNATMNTPMQRRNEWNRLTHWSFANNTEHILNTIKHIQQWHLGLQTTDQANLEIFDLFRLTRYSSLLHHKSHLPIFFYFIKSNRTGGWCPFIHSHSMKKWICV